MTQRAVPHESHSSIAVHCVPISGRRICADIRGVYVGALEESQARRLFDSDSPVEFSAPDSLLFERQGKLLAQRISLDTFTLNGDAVPVAPRVPLPRGPTTGPRSPLRLSGVSPMGRRAVYVR